MAKAQLCLYFWSVCFRRPLELASGPSAVALSSGAQTSAFDRFLQTALHEIATEEWLKYLFINFIVVIE